MEEELYHYGTKRHSGRYPWGSGDNPYQGEAGFLGMADRLHKEGLSEKEVADYFGLTIKQYRAKKSNAKNAKRAADASEALRLKDKGYSNVAIGKKMGIPESTVRNLLDPAIKERATKATKTAEVLEKAVADKKYIDIGGGVENQMGISRTSLDNSIEMLKDKGYNIYYIQTDQLGTGKKTSIKVLASPDAEYSEVYKNRDKIEFPGYHSEDKGSSFSGVKPPVSISSDRIKIVYREDGGIDKDGIIEIRRGVDDISLGNSRYAQVRVAVDGTHYLKGMAMYSDNMPDGVDILFNTNKTKGTPKEKVFKEMKDDPDNPFGANIRPQRDYVGKDGKRHQSALNIVNEEGDWSTWSKSLSSQMLSKQSPMLAKKQLKLAYDLKQEEFDEIMGLTNPVVKKALLDKFADGCDSASVHLKAAGLPRQASKVILPLPDMKENEVYAPTFRNGEQVALIRYPHGGTFEIPTLTVNNKQKTANSLIKNAPDAIGIHPKVAERLSGADFDGDTVLVIPTKGVKIKTSKPLKGLEDFDPKVQYPAYPGMIKTGAKGSGFNKQRAMGDVSNLITDMTIGGADPSELAAAVRHSMVVIDAEKHNLNYKQSFEDNNIAYLKTKYQGRANAGASTLISRASGDARVPVRKEITNKNIMTPDELRRYNNGEKIFRETGETYFKNGKEVKRLQKTTKMAEAKDAYSLSSGSVIESVYAEHANKLKSLANQARKESRDISRPRQNKEARILYSKEVESLNYKLNEAQKNRPLERKAQLVANAKVKSVIDANPNMDKDQIKKLKGRALTQARVSVGANKQNIKITDREWEAIQAGAISSNKLEQIIANSDLDVLKQLAMPRSYQGMSPGKQTKAKALVANGYTLAEVADQLGVSTSTIQRVIAA